MMTCTSAIIVITIIVIIRRTDRSYHHQHQQPSNVVNGFELTMTMRSTRTNSYSLKKINLYNNNSDKKQPLSQHVLHSSPSSSELLPEFLSTLSRRDMIHKFVNGVVVVAAAVTTTTTVNVPPCFAVDNNKNNKKKKKDPTASASSSIPRPISSESLISIIPRMAYDGPATNVTIPIQVVEQIERMTVLLEEKYQYRQNYVTDPKSQRQLDLTTATDGGGGTTWKLVYSNGPEIAQLAASLPLGFVLGPTYQPLDLTTMRFENQGRIVHPYRLAVLETNVVGDIAIAPKLSTNAVGVINDRNNRIDVNFVAIVFQLDELLGIPLHPPYRKIIIPKQQVQTEDDDSSSSTSSRSSTRSPPQPANDITYLDDSVRIVRGGDGAVFIFQKETINNNNNNNNNNNGSNNKQMYKPMLTTSERNNLVAEGTKIKTSTAGRRRNKLHHNANDGNKVNEGMSMNNNNNNNNNAVIVGGNKDSFKGQPELNFLFNDNIRTK